MRFLGPSASDIMVKRYDVQDVEAYMADHEWLWMGTFYCGVALAGFVAAGAIAVTHDIESVVPGLLAAAVAALVLSAICLLRLRRGAKA